MAKLTEGKTPGDFLLFEEDKFYSRKRVTIAAGADLEPGAVLGAITATGKLQSSVRTATDGSEAPVAVLLAAPGGEQIPAGGDGTLAEPGRYVLLCAIPTGAHVAEYLVAAATSEGPPQVDGGPPHFMNGMFAEITVTG